MIKLDIFVNFLKEKHFLGFKTTIFFFSFGSLERVRYFWVEHCTFFSKLLSATNQQLFCVTAESDIRQGFSNYPPPLYEFSSVNYIKLWLSTKDLQKNVLNI